MSRPLTIADHASALRDGTAVRELLDATLAGIETHDPTRPEPGHTSTPDELNAFTQVFAEEALRRADELDARLGTLRSAGEAIPPLLGVPIAIKDNLCTTLGRTTCASRMLASYRSPFDATVIERLLEAGAIIVGKANMDEFAMGSSGEHSCFGVTRNPWDTQRVCGGSSSGSAAIVGAGLTPIALGSDTGGSVREPAAFTGCVGLKPTYGRVSRYGLVAFASSLDQIGPMGRCVEDVALVLDVISGMDRLDSTSSDRAAPNAAEAVRSVRGDAPSPMAGRKVGVLRDAPGSATKPAVVDAMERAAESLRVAGATLVEIELPALEHAIATYYIIATAEASSNLARFDGVRYGHRSAEVPGQTLVDMYERSRSEGFGDEVRRRILLGTFVLSSGYYDAYYTRALRVRRLIKQEFERAFGEVEAILMPTTPDPPFRIGEKNHDPMSLYLEDYYTVTANLAGVPAVSLPIMTTRVDEPGDGTGGAELPIGVQLIGRWFDEAGMLRTAKVIERAVGFRGLRLE